MLDDRRDQLAGQDGGRRVPLGLDEMSLQDRLRGALAEVGLEHGGEGEATTGPTAALSISLRRHRRSR